jgi:hypothetical protein
MSEEPQPPTEEPSEFERFRDFAKQILSVPKEEMDRKLAEEKEAKKRKPKKQ